MDKRTLGAIKVAKRYIKELKKNNIRITKAYLFGSYASGNPHRYSDIDIAIVSPQFSGNRLMDNFRIGRLRRNVDLRISPIGYRPQDFTMDYIIPNEAISKGIRIV